MNKYLQAKECEKSTIYWLTQRTSDDREEEKVGEV